MRLISEMEATLGVPFIHLHFILKSSGIKLGCLSKRRYLLQALPFAILQLVRRNEQVYCSFNRRCRQLCSTVAIVDAK